MIPVATEFFSLDSLAIPRFALLTLPAACLLLLFITTVFSVLPAVAREAPPSSARRTWTELWLPLLAAFPVVLVAVLHVPEAQRNGSLTAIWWGVGPLIVAAAAFYGLLLVITAPDPLRAPDRIRAIRDEPAAWSRARARLGIMLAVLGLVVCLMAAAGRLTAWHGQVLVTLGIVWMWLCTPGRAEPAPGSASPSTDAASASTVSKSAVPAPRKRVFFCLDWAGRLQHPLSVPARVGLTLLPLALALLAWGIELPANWLAGVAIAAALFPLALAAGIGRRVGVADAERFLASTLVFAVLFGLGGHAATLLNPGQTFWWIFDTPYAALEPTVVMGLGSLLFAGFGLLGFGLLLLLRPARTETFVLSLSALALVAIAFAVLASEPTGRVYAVVEPVIRFLQPAGDPNAPPAELFMPPSATP